MVVQSNCRIYFRTSLRSASIPVAPRFFSQSAPALKPRLVILGSGWGAYRLLQKVDRKRYDVTVISPSAYFTFSPLLASASVGTLEYRCAMEPVRAYAKTSTYYRAWADHANFDRKLISCTAATEAFGLDPKTTERKTWELPYDKLCIAVGAYSQTFNTPGVKEHAFFLKSMDDARAIRKRIFDIFEEASQAYMSEEAKRRLLRFCVVGGGPTGVEWSAELHDLISSDIARAYPGLEKLCSITIYETSDRVLGSFDKNLSDYAMAKFRREGITIKPGHRVLALKPGIVETAEDGEVPFGMVVWSTGLAPNPFVESLQCQKHDKTKSILTDDYCRLLGEDGNPNDDVFAIGDAAVIDGALLPATAQVANQKALFVAKALNLQVRDKPLAEPFTFKNAGTLAYLGDWSAIFEGPKNKDKDGFAVTGRAAFAVWRSAYFLQTLSLRNKILVPFYWFFNWCFGRSLAK